MTVIPEHTFLGGITFEMHRASAKAKKKAHQEEAFKFVSNSVQILSDSGMEPEIVVQYGDPAEEILKTADKFDASLVVMGAKGLTNYPAFRLGSVSQRVLKHTRASVLLARKKTVRVNRGLQPSETSAVINRVIFATDGSKYANTAAQFLLDLPLPQQSHVIILTALQSHVAEMMRMPTVDFRTEQQLLEELQEAEEKEAQSIVGNVEELFKRKRYKTTSAIMQGRAGESIIKAAKKHDPDIIVLGSRGLSGIESFLLGSVSERVARHAPCSVLIVRGFKKSLTMGSM